MASRTARLLALLELLQDQGHATGSDLATELGIARRTLRRDVAALQELGIPIDGEPGVGGGYRMRPGYRLPPLMLGDDEVVAVVLAVLAAHANEPPASTDAVEGALTKIYRVLSPTLRRQVAALEATVLFSTTGEIEPVRGDITLRLAEAVRRRRRVRLRYVSHQGIRSERLLSPWGLVVHCGRCYLIAHDHTRAASRTFRVDRVGDARIEEGAPAQIPPLDFDPIVHLERSLASLPGAHQVSVLLDLRLEVARARLPDATGLLTQTDHGVRLELRVESLAWIGRVLAGLGCPFTIEQPDELRHTIASLSQSLRESAEAETDPQRIARLDLTMIGD